MTPAAVICSAIGGSNREERTSQVLDALTRSGWAFANMKEIGGTSLGILEDAIAFIEGLAVVPLLTTDDIEMRLEDVQTHARIEAASLRKRLADRSVRPVEPAATVAEVKAWLLGDPATGQWIEVDGHRVEYSRGMGTPAHVLASAFQAERARADDNRQKLRDANADRSQLLANLQALRTEMATRVTDMQDRAEAAEQRAADALARAEKAERALETAQEERKAASEAMRHVGAHFPECAAEFDAIMDRRASREAQPATDGGDNG